MRSLGRIACALVAGIIHLCTHIPGSVAADSTMAVGPIKHVYATVDTTALSLHVFTPVNLSDTGNGAIVVFHGGGWVMGDPEWAYGRARHFAELGLVAIAAQYRLSDQKSVTPIEAMADARGAIRWVRSHADALGVDPDRIAAFGWSAGAHLAASAAVFIDSLESVSSAVPNALILVSPALHLEIDPWLKQLLLSRADPADISPATHVHKGMPPTLIQVGETDTVTPAAGARIFHERMLAAGSQSELVVYPGVGHLFTPSNLPDDGWPQPDTVVSKQASSKVDSFLIALKFVK